MPLKKSWLNFRNDYPGMMSPGMVFTVEPAVSEGTSSLQILRDGWTAVTKDNSRSAQFEHTILITGKNFILIKMQNFFCRITTYLLYNANSCSCIRPEEYGIVGNMNFLAAMQYCRMIFSWRFIIPLIIQYITYIVCWPICNASWHIQVLW